MPLFEVRRTEKIACSRKARIEFNIPLALFNYRIEVILEQVYPRDMIVDDRRKGIKLLRPLDLSHRVIELSLCLEITGKPLVRRRVIRIEADGAFEFFFSLRPAPHLHIYESRGRVCLGERVVNLEGAVSRRPPSPPPLARSPRPDARRLAPRRALRARR